MKVKFVFNSKLAKVLNVGAITLYPFVFVATNPFEALQTKIIAHELVHVEQVRNLGWFKFYASYLWQFTKTIIKTRSFERAYVLNHYEIEAYSRQNGKDLVAKSCEVFVSHSV